MPPKSEPAAATEDKTWLSLYLDPDLKRRWRIHCAEQEMSMNEAIVELIRERLDDA